MIPRSILLNTTLPPSPLGVHHRKQPKTYDSRRMIFKAKKQKKFTAIPRNC
jgi:hypothetical protein